MFSLSIYISYLYSLYLFVASPYLLFVSLSHSVFDGVYSICLELFNKWSNLNNNKNLNKLNTNSWQHTVFVIWKARFFPFLVFLFAFICCENVIVVFEWIVRISFVRVREQKYSIELNCFDYLYEQNHNKKKMLLPMPNISYIFDRSFSFAVSNSTNSSRMGSIELRYQRWKI